MNHLEKLESQSIYIIREAYNQFRKLALLWSIGKDSTVLLWLCRKAFYGKLSFPVVHIDTGYKFPEMYEFRDKLTKKLNLNLIIGKNEDALKKGITCCMDDQMTCCKYLKTKALKQVIEKEKFKALIVGIRRDEHGVRAKERYFSPRDEEFKWNYKNQPPELWDQFKSKGEEDNHLRIHPLLHWTELDIWNYIQKEDIPTNKLYFSKNGKRYRSLGCTRATVAVKSEANTVKKIIEEIKTTTTSERAGRAQDKEKAYIMQKLRSLGYM
jgi:sulfate adenylyltransferase subunit 2